jgi:hypothetical protein
MINAASVNGTSPIAVQQLEQIELISALRPNSGVQATL